MIKVNEEVVEITRFPDGTPSFKFDPDFSKLSYSVIEWNYENNEEMMIVFFLAKHLKTIFKVVGLSMPYIPCARQDRTKNQEDVFFLKYFADFINSLEFSFVSVRDPHSSVSEALFNNLCVQSAEVFIKETIDRCDPNIIFYPDEGAMKRYSSMAPMEYAFGVKRRDWATGKIEGLDVIGDAEAIKGKNILIVDDICSKGGTFYHSAKKLKEMGAANIYLYITHCENTILEGELLDSGLIEKVYTTRSIFTKEHEKIVIL